jgi:hypothetical protein
MRQQKWKTDIETVFTEAERLVLQKAPMQDFNAEGELAVLKWNHRGIHVADPRVG